MKKVSCKAPCIVHQRFRHCKITKVLPIHNIIDRLFESWFRSVQNVHDHHPFHVRWSQARMRMPPRALNTTGRFISARTKLRVSFVLLVFQALFHLLEEGMFVRKPHGRSDVALRGKGILRPERLSGEHA